MILCRILSPRTRTAPPCRRPRPDPPAPDTGEARPVKAPPADLAAVRAAIRDLLPELRRRYPVTSIGVFGSWAGGTRTPDSDLDVLADFDGPIESPRRI